MKNDLFVTAGEVAQDLGVSKPFAYKLVRQMNEELEAKGFITMKKNSMVWRRQIKREVKSWRRTKMKNVERGMYRFTIMTGQEKTVGK